MNPKAPHLSNVTLDQWDHPVFQTKGISVDVLRLDKIHPDISGNKWFKLKYYLEKAKSTDKKKLISFGGAYSNHILALAAAAKLHGFECKGKIRGERPPVQSRTLTGALDYGMKIEFLSRQEYDRQKNIVVSDGFLESDQTVLWIPEGGSGEEGRRGAEEILSVLPGLDHPFVCAAAGTGATLAGLLNGSAQHQKVIGVSVLKGTKNFEPLALSWIKNPDSLNRLQLIHEDHFGGYAKKTTELLDFMNQLYQQSGIPTDFVYTGKLFFSVLRLADSGTFPAGSKVLILHSGGLRGNHSVGPDQLQF